MTIGSSWSPSAKVALLVSILLVAVQSFTSHHAFRNSHIATQLCACTNDSQRRSLLLDTCAIATAFLPANAVVAISDDENDFIKELKARSDANRAKYNKEARTKALGKLGPDQFSKLKNRPKFVGIRRIDGTFKMVTPEVLQDLEAKGLVIAEYDSYVNEDGVVVVDYDKGKIARFANAESQQIVEQGTVPAPSPSQPIEPEPAQVAQPEPLPEPAPPTETTTEPTPEPITGPSLDQSPTPESTPDPTPAPLPESSSLEPVPLPESLAEPTPEPLVAEPGPAPPPEGLPVETTEPLVKEPAPDPEISERFSVPEPMAAEQARDPMIPERLSTADPLPGDQTPDLVVPENTPEPTPDPQSEGQSPAPAVPESLPEPTPDPLPVDPAPAPVLPESSPAPSPDQLPAEQANSVPVPEPTAQSEAPPRAKLDPPIAQTPGVTAPAAGMGFVPADPSGRW